MLCLIDEYTREALAIRIKRQLNSMDVLETLADATLCRGTPGYLRSDNGLEFVARALRGWVTNVGTQTAYIEPGSPEENGYCKSFNSKLRNELLNGEIFYTLREAEVLIESLAPALQHGQAAQRARLPPPTPEAIVALTRPCAVAGRACASGRLPSQHTGRQLESPIARFGNRPRFDQLGQRSSRYSDSPTLAGWSCCDRGQLAAIVH